MNTRLATAALAVLIASLLGCSARLSVKTDIANPSAVGAVRVVAAAHGVCRTVLTGEDEAVLREAMSALGHASRTCAAALREQAQAAPPSEKDWLLGSADALEGFEREFQPRFTEVLSRRAGILPALAKSLEAPCSDSVRGASELLLYDDQRKDASLEIGHWAELLTEQCGKLDGVSKEVKAAAEKTEAYKSIIGSGSLTRSDYAFAVATLDDTNWEPFNVATGDAHGGNMDVAIKMNEPGDFTVKGMRFDASKSAELVGKSLTQVLLLAAGHAGLAPTSASGATLAVAPHNALASAQASQINREAMENAYRVAAVEIALLVGAEAGEFSLSAEKRKAAIQRIKSVIASHAPRLDLSTLP